VAVKWFKTVIPALVILLGALAKAPADQLTASTLLDEGTADDWSVLGENPWTLRSMDELFSNQGTWIQAGAEKGTFLQNGSGVDFSGTRFPTRNTSNSETGEDLRLGLQYRAPIGYSNSFLYSRSTLDDSNFGTNGRHYQQVFGYGLRLVQSDTFAFDIIPGLGSRHYIERPLEESMRIHGNLQQNITWQLSEGFVVNQNFTTTLEKTEEENLSAVMNLDLETLFSDRLSFRLSYEVHYDDTENEIMEQRESRLSTSIGYRF